MKKFFVILIVAMMATLMTACGTKETEETRLQEETYRVCFNTVNIREEPDQSSDVIYQMELGDVVFLTGKVVEYRFSTVNSRWYETDEGYWIVSDAVMDSNTFKWKFGNY